MTRLHIDLVNGTLEVEGEEEFVDKIYKDFKERLATSETSLKPLKIIKEKKSRAKSKLGIKKTTQTSTKSKTKSFKESYTPVKDLDLAKGSRDMSLKDYYKQKSPRSFIDKNVVFVFYLKKTVKVTQVTLNHIYTCYEEVSSRKPAAFKQSVADTSRKGYLNTASYEDINITVRGENLIKELSESDKKSQSN